MKTRCKSIASFVLLLSFGPVCPVSAQADQQVHHVRRSLSGQKTLVTYREGGALYGTYVLLEIHLCDSGQYMLFGQSRKQTVLGNEQPSRWRDSGRWDVLSSRGQVGLVYVSASGHSDFVPIHLQSDGRIRTTDGFSIERRGRAQC